MEATLAVAFEGCLLAALLPRAVGPLDLAIGAAAGGAFGAAMHRARPRWPVLALGWAALVGFGWWTTKDVDDRWLRASAVFGGATLAAVLAAAPLPAASRLAPEAARLAVAAALALFSAITLGIVGSEAAGEVGPIVTAFADQRVASWVIIAASATCLAFAARSASRRGAALTVGAIAAGIFVHAGAIVLGHGAPLGHVASAVSRDRFTCALLADRTARCWGENLHGQLGDRTTRARQAPVVVEDVRDIVELEPPCARLASGVVRCWGAGRATALPDGSLPKSRLLRARGISGCVVSIDDEVLCWESSAIRRIPLSAVGAVDLFGSADYGCVRFPEALACWSLRGSTSFEPPADRATPIALLPRCPFPAGGDPTIPGSARRLGRWYGEVTSAGRVRVVPYPPRDGSPCEAPSVLDAVADATAITDVIGSGLVLSRSGSVRPLTVDGDGARPALCVGSPLLHGITAVASTGATSCAVRTDGTMLCWGENRFGEVGDGSRVQQAQPTLVRR